MQLIYWSNWCLIKFRYSKSYFLPKRSTNSAKDDTPEEKKSQVHRSKINSNLPFNDENDDKQTDTLKNTRIKHGKKVFFINASFFYININFIRNKLYNLFKFTYSLSNFLAVSEPVTVGEFNLPGFMYLIEKINLERVEEY